MRIASVVLVAAFAGAACDGAGSPRAASRQRPASTPTPEERKPSLARVERRLIPIAEAVERLQPHVDVPVALPRDAGAGLPNLRGWRADPKYLEWSESNGIRAGSMTLRQGRRILILSYGRAGFDGCGDRTNAIETNVLGQPALVTQSREHVWSHVLWPVTPRGSTGRYGLTGTFLAWQIVRLAESMEPARVRAVNHQRGC